MYFTEDEIKKLSEKYVIDIKGPNGYLECMFSNSFSDFADSIINAWKEKQKNAVKNAD